MKDVKEQKQNDNGEIIEKKQGQVIKFQRTAAKHGRHYFIVCRRSLSANVLFI